MPRCRRFFSRGRNGRTEGSRASDVSRAESIPYLPLTYGTQRKWNSLKYRSAVRTSDSRGEIDRADICQVFFSTNGKLFRPALATRGYFSPRDDFSRYFPPRTVHHRGHIERFQNEPATAERPNGYDILFTINSTLR